jgi:hypothetical protein
MASLDEPMKGTPKTRTWRRGMCVAHGLGMAILLALHPEGAGATEAEVGQPSASIPALQAQPPVAQGLPDWARESTSPDVRYMARWVAESGDNAGMPYIIIDKINARVFVLDAGGHLKGTAPALLGMVAGDRSVAGIGDQKVSAIRPENRTTPAGRFVASVGRDLHGQDIVWIDYPTALAMHRVVKGTPSERRAQRLESATPEDNRISYGCINVPVLFYEKVVGPAFARSNGVVYILPELSPARDMFGGHDVPAVSQ